MTATDGGLRQRLVLSTALAAPAVAVSVVPALQFTYWQWIVLTLTAPVVVWGAWPFHRAAATGLRRGAATADTLVSLGTLAALGWSLHVLLFGGAGTPGTVQPATLTLARTDAVYLGIAAGVTAVLLAVRHTVARTAGGGWLATAFAPIVIVLAVGTMGFWLGTGGAFPVAVAATVAVLIVACPCALVAGPASPRVDTLVLGSTGALTNGRKRLHAVHPVGGTAPDEALRLAGAVEHGREHPVGDAIAAEARERCGELLGVSEFDSLPGLGVRGLVSELDGETVRAHAVLVGRPELLAEHGVDLPAELATTLATAADDGTTAVVVAWDGSARAVLTVTDAIAPEAPAALARLRRLGVRPVLLAGESAAAAARAAQATGIAACDVAADLAPEDVAERLRALQADGLVVAMIGPGIADVRVVGADLAAAVDALRLARRTAAVIRSDRCWAFAYTLAALPAAAAGLLNPMVAGLGMACSSAVVMINSARLRRLARTPAT